MVSSSNNNNNNSILGTYIIELSDSKITPLSGLYYLLRCKFHQYLRAKLVGWYRLNYISSSNTRIELWITSNEFKKWSRQHYRDWRMIFDMTFKKWKKVKTNPQKLWNFLYGVQRYSIRYWLVHSDHKL